MYTIASLHFALKCTEKKLPCKCTIDDYAVIRLETYTDYSFVMKGTLKECGDFINSYNNRILQDEKLQNTTLRNKITKFFNNMSK